MPFSGLAIFSLLSLIWVRSRASSAALTGDAFDVITGPQLDLGKGRGRPETITFTEISSRGNGLRIHIVNLPHRVQITIEEGTSQSEDLPTITFLLRTGGCGKLDDNEFLYLLLPHKDGFEVSYVYDDNSRGFTIKATDSSLDASRVGKAFESIVASLRYINLADEPSLYCDSKKLNRYIDVTVYDRGSPQLNITITVNVLLQFVNDKAPELTLMVQGDCTADTCSDHTSIFLLCLQDDRPPVVDIVPTSETYIVGCPPVLIAKSIQVTYQDRRQSDQSYILSASITVRGSMQDEILIDGLQAANGGLSLTNIVTDTSATVTVTGYASAEIYSRVLSTARYRSSAEELTVDHVIFHLTISDGEFTTNASIRLGVAANVLHIINLYPGDRFNVTDRVPAVVASELEIQSDLEQGSQNIQEATVEICQPNVCDDNLKAYSHDIGYEKLGFKVESPAITTRYFQSNGMDDFSRLRFSGSATIGHYVEVLRSVTYFNSRETVSSPASRVVKVTVSGTLGFAEALVAIPIVFKNEHPPVCVATDGVTNLTLDENGLRPNFSLSCTDQDMPTLVVFPLVNSRQRRSGPMGQSHSETIWEAMESRDYESFTLAETKYVSALEGIDLPIDEICLPFRPPPVFSCPNYIYKRSVSDNTLNSFLQIVPFNDILTNLTNQLEDQSAGTILIQAFVNDGVFNSTAVNVSITVSLSPLNNKEPELKFPEGIFVLVGGQQPIIFKSLSMTYDDKIVQDHRNIIWMSITIEGTPLNCGSFRINMELLKEDLICECDLEDGIRVLTRDVNNGAPLERFEEILQSVVYSTEGRCSSGTREILFQFKTTILQSINPRQITSFSYPLIVEGTILSSSPEKETE